MLVPPIMKNGQSDLPVERRRIMRMTNGNCGYTDHCDNSCGGCNSSLLFFILVFLVLFGY